MALDERLRRELDRAGRPADPTGVYEHLIRRRERRRIARRARTGLLGVAVIVGSAAGIVALSRVFAPGPQGIGADVANGRIAFTNFEPEYAIPEVTAAWYISTMEPDGTDVSFLGPRAVDEALYPTFSPDGRQIAFAGFTAEPEERALYLVDVGTGSISKILVLDRQKQIDGLEWSPDGSRIGILYTEFEWTEPPPEFGARNFDSASTIWTIAPDGSDLRQVTAVGRESGFSWSPDVTRIAFSRYEPIDPGERTVANDIYIIGADGTGETKLTNDGASMSPAWSPDGQLIAFESFGSDHDSGLDLYLMNADGSGRRRLTDDPGNEIRPTWSPDGTRIAFAETAIMDDNSVDCFVSAIAPDGTSRSRLFGMPDEEGCPGSNGISWAPAIESPTPSASPTVDGSPSVEPTPDESPAGEDIGLGFPVCDVTSVRGEFAPGVFGTVFVATKTSDVGGCPEHRGGFQVVAVDVTGDGLADTSYGPLECEADCYAYAAPDVNGDGTDEVLVQNIEFTTPGLKLFDVVSDGPSPALVPATIAPPGSAPFGYQGFEGNTEPQFWVGGDAFVWDGLACEVREGRRVLLSTTGQIVPPDTPDSVWQLHRTALALIDGVLTVIGVEEFEVPLGEESDLFSMSGCGANLAPYPDPDA